MYPLPEQPEPKTATLRPLPNVDAAGPIPLSAPLPDMLSAPLPAEPLTTRLATGPLAPGPLAAPLAEDMLPTVPGTRPGVPGPAYPDACPGPGPGVLGA